ncbi:MAG: hypothetical protein M1827_003414 [Pycnora praestabilis]|nr:MAG: hypothetical protein M1827_003414 [Pycnora praestabilis]
MDDSLSPRSGPAKVEFSEEPESISPSMHPAFSHGDEDAESGYPNHSRSPKQFSAKIGRRLSGRPSINGSTSSLHSIDSISSNLKLEPSTSEGEVIGNGNSEKGSHGQNHVHGQLISQVVNWLQQEKAKRAARKSKSKLISKTQKLSNYPPYEGIYGPLDGEQRFRPKSPSQVSEDGISLEALERILGDSMVIDSERKTTPGPGRDRRGSYFPRRTSSIRKLKRGSIAGSSDTEYHDGDAIVPTCDAVLDNSKTLGYTGGVSESDTDLLGSMSKRAAQEKEAWIIFKNEIVRLAHTLRLKGWRRVPLDRGGDIDVERLSGALTNAVYVVSPPKDLPAATPGQSDTTDSLIPRKPPPKLLLRIYGPQVEHLIDRESELQILRRLARKRIGPRLLGTFTNGRFEEFFHARTLTARDLRIQETSKQIAKRMRELHDGIELLEQERDAGPFVWQNWDKWVERSGQVISWVDKQILENTQSSNTPKRDAWKTNGLVCGVEWSVFRQTVDRYRKWLDERYGGSAAVRQQLVFAHNDTQYGNLLRLEPSGESPLLLPANEHKRLVVIDFEYASANLPGLEFANHFTEWCYNYHDSERSYALNSNKYPTPEEQHRFIRSYVQHRPQYHPRASATPSITPNAGPSSSISSFMLDSRAPPSQVAEEEARREQDVESEVQRLMHETRIWRVACSAQWVAWGIVQAKIPGLDDTNLASTDPDKTPSQSPNRGGSDPLSPENTGLVADAHSKRPEGLVAEALREGHEMPHEEDDEDEFDYLRYAQERAMLFWGDVLGLGIVKEEELPRELLEKVKVVNY